MLETYPILSIVPPLVAIILVILTKRVLISLGSGVLVAALLLANFNPLSTIIYIWDALVRLVWVDGELNLYTILIVLFLLELGVLTSVIMMSGGASAFTEWAAKRIKSRRAAQVLTGLLGMLIFIDDYFNSLAVGQVARPITDRYRVSRAKLAYLIDSSSAPVVVLMPFSSWGASIMGIMGPILVGSALVMTQLEAFIFSAAMNYYAIAALILLWITAIWGLDFGSMRREELRAAMGEGVQNKKDSTPDPFDEDLPRHEPGAMRSLVWPFVLLVIGVVVGMYVTGGIAGDSWSPIATLANADVAMSLNIGGVAALISAFYYLFKHTHNNPEFVRGTKRRGVYQGAKSMVPAILILLAAWTLADLIGELGTGEYLASLVDYLNMPAMWLVPMLFVLGGGMAFATGTSWGSFGILLPLAGEMMNSISSGDELLIAAFGAILAGSVWGDHSSPISDTTILSSTGAACSVGIHVSTQLPYALTGALAALVGYVGYAMTHNGIVGFIVTVVVLLSVAFTLKKVHPTVETVVETPAEPTR